MAGRIAVVLLAWSLLLPTAAGQSVVRDDFEGPETSLRDAGGDATYRVETHQRIAQGAHSGRWCEHLSVRGANGTAVYFSRAIAPARVISELSPSVWIKADRPGPQIIARVTLPRSRDARTGKPLRTLVRGSLYTNVGAWQQLRFENMPQALERQVRVLRAAPGAGADAREAYVDLILLNLYGGPGVTNAWIDDLEVGGVVSPPSLAEGADQMTTMDPGVGGTRRLPAASVSPTETPRVTVEGGLLLVGGVPFFPRAIDYNGESLARLKALGFNAVRVERPPAAKFLSEASQLGLWVIAPPPGAQELETRAQAPGGKIPTTFDPVLAWDVGRGLSNAELEATRHWVKLVAAADSLSRPILCGADSQLRSFTRPPVNLFLARREPLGTSLQLRDYAAWLHERSQLVLAGTPLWASIQTEISPRLNEQLAVLAPGEAAPLALDECQIRMLARAALGAGARGLCFESHSRLDADDAATKRRAAMLELVNLELDLIARWPASGTAIASASSNDPHAVGTVVGTDRSRLLMPLFTHRHGQLVLGNPTAKPLTFTVTGVPEGNRAFELSPTQFRPLPSKRVIGGTEVRLESLERDSLVVFTQDQTIVETLTKQVAKTRGRAGRVAREVAAAQLLDAQQAEQQLTGVGQGLPATRKALASADADLRECERQLASSDPRSYDSARRVMQSVRDVERRHFEQAVSASDLPLCNPLATHFTLLPKHHLFVHEMGAARRSANLLAEGAFEDREAMLRAGWRIFEHQSPGVTTSGDLSHEAAHSGNLGLLLRAAAPDPATRPLVLETPPLWVTSAPVQVERGQLVQIQFWLRIYEPIAASVDSLLIVDSLAGEPLALRVARSEDWRQFTMFRGAAASGPMSLTFALAGLGEVAIDDVAIQVVERAQTPAAQPAAGPAASPFSAAR